MSSASPRRSRVKPDKSLHILCYKMAFGYRENRTRRYFILLESNALHDALPRLLSMNASVSPRQ